MVRARSVRRALPAWVAGSCLALAAAVSLVPAAPAAAAPACTRYASTAGSDSAPGTEAAPFRTAQRLADSLSAGQVGCLQPGAVFGGVKFNRSGTTLTTAPGGAKATLLGKTWVPDSTNDVVIENLVLNGRTSGARVSPDVQGDRVVFRGNDITNDNTAICLHIGSNAGYGIAYGTVVDSNRIFRCGRMPATNFDHGIYVNHAYDTRITNNLIYDNSDYGVHLYPGANRTLVTNNVIDGNGRGVTFSGEGGLVSSNNTVEDNIISNSLVTSNVESWWAAGVGTGNRADRNCLWNGRRGNIDASNGGFSATANTVADPLFTNRAAKDFSLRADSPCAGKGPLAGALPAPPPSIPAPDPAPAPAPPPSIPAPDPAPAPAPAPTTGANAVTNGSFESGTAGWTTWQAGITRVALAGAPEGSYVARVARTTGTAFTVDDAPTSVGSATVGEVYTGTAQVQAASASAMGKTVKLYLRERTASGAIVRTVAGPAVTLGAAFVPVSANLTALASGNQIEVYVGQSGAVAGDAFHMDAVTLAGGSAPPPSIPAPDPAPAPAPAPPPSIPAPDPAPAPAPAPTTGANAVTNGSFESGTAGWTTWQAGITRVALAGAPEGSYVARVARTTGTAFTVDDAPTSVGSATVGEVYTGTAQVQAASASAMGKTVKLYLRERTASGAIVRTVAGPAVTLGAAFVPASANLTALASGNQIEVYVGQSGAVAGDAFHMDAVTLTR